MAEMARRSERLAELKVVSLEVTMEEIRAVTGMENWKKSIPDFKGDMHRYITKFIKKQFLVANCNINA